MADPDSKGGAQDNGRRSLLNGTTYDLFFFLTTLALVAFIALDVGTALAGGQYYSVMVISVVLTVLLAYLLYRFDRRRRKPVGHDFNI